MPYTGPDDPKLPKNVKALSPKKRRQWVHVWMSTYDKTNNESKAFAAANAAVKESAGGRRDVSCQEAASEDTTGSKPIDGKYCPSAPGHSSPRSSPMERMIACDVVALEEANVADGANEFPVVVIKPGFNRSKQRYYPAETLQRDYKVFEGVKMFADHPTEREERERPEHTLDRWVGTLKNVFAEKDGTVRGTAVVIDDSFRAKLHNLRKAGLLPEMGTSIRALAEGVKDTVQGVKTRVVERFLKGRSVDFVTFAGAGGHVEAVESDDGRDDIELIDEDGLRERRPELVQCIEAKAINDHKSREGRERKAMDEKTQELETKVKDLEQQVKEAETERDAAKETADNLTAELDDARRAEATAKVTKQVNEALAKTDLPEIARERVRQQFADNADLEKLDERIAEAVTRESEYIATLRDAKVKHMGGGKGDGGGATRLYEHRRQQLIAQGVAEAEADERARDFARL